MAKGRRGWNLRGPAKPVIRGPDHYAWKGNDATIAVGRRRAIVLYPELGECRECGGRAIERHHVDSNPLNNAAENVVPLCRRCHMRIDGRLATFVSTANRKTVPASPCAECERVYKPLRKGLCAACDVRARRARRAMER